MFKNTIRPQHHLSCKAGSQLHNQMVRSAAYLPQRLSHKQWPDEVGCCSGQLVGLACSTSLPEAPLISGDKLQLGGPSAADLHWRWVVWNLAPFKELCRPWAAITGACTPLCPCRSAGFLRDATFLALQIEVLCSQQSAAGCRCQTNDARRAGCIGAVQCKARPGNYSHHRAEQSFDTAP